MIICSDSIYSHVLNSILALPRMHGKAVDRKDAITDQNEFRFVDKQQSLIHLLIQIS